MQRHLHFFFTIYFASLVLLRRRTKKVPLYWLSGRSRCHYLSVTRIPASRVSICHSGQHLISRAKRIWLPVQSHFLNYKWWTDDKRGHCRNYKRVKGCKTILLSASCIFSAHRHNLVLPTLVAFSSLLINRVTPTLVLRLGHSAGFQKSSPMVDIRKAARVDRKGKH